MENENYINQEIRVRMLENITREIKEDIEKSRIDRKTDQEKARQETTALRLELSDDLKEALRHFDSKINNLMLCMIGGFAAMILTKFFS